MSIAKSFIKSRNSYKVTFKVPRQANPYNKDIRVLGEFNNWNWDEAPSLKSVNGSFKTDVELTAGRKYEYRYLIDRTEWINDGIADAYTPSPYAYVDNCVVELDRPQASQVAVAKKKKVDFTKIEGIGPKIAQLIVAAGYNSYEELGKAKKADLQAVLTLAGKRYKMHDPSTWARQSKLLATDKITALKKLQKELKGGKKRV